MDSMASELPMECHLKRCHPKDGLLRGMYMKQHACSPTITSDESIMHGLPLEAAMHHGTHLWVDAAGWVDCWRPSDAGPPMTQPANDMPARE